jgi:alpha-galactosidase
MDGAKALGMELFLLDDGWFGDKYPRNDDSRGLGDWAPDIRKAPRGIKALTDAAKDRDLRFGIWLEPEMVNPKSEQFEEHPNWVIQQPKRALDLHRNQMVLDLTQPEVRDFVFQVADKILSNNPDISYVKWDCNRYLTQPGSPGLPPGRGTHLSVDYVWSLYDIFDRIAKNHPSVEIMMCSGGGGRVDYEAMRYAHEFWPSDMTDPVRRIFIQWGYSYFFPAIAISSHVTMAGGRPLKFAFDVAMSGRLGMDVDLDGLSEGDKEFAKRAINSYKSIREVVQLGQLFRLESPYDGERSSLMYVHERRSVVFAFSRGKVRSSPIRLKGLHEKQSYLVGEINSSTAGHETLEPILGQELMKIGLPIPQMAPLESLVFELTRL